jgi:hypothetical protein
MKNISSIAVLIALTALTQCTPFKISMSEGLANANELAVKGRQGILINQKLSFGEYKTGKVKRSWTESGSAIGGDQENLWVKNTESNQKMQFSLSDSMGNSSEVFCIAKASSEDWTIGRNPNSIVNIMGEILGVDGPSENNFAVDIYLPKEPAPWQMRLDMQESQRSSKKYKGFLAQSKDKYYTIHPLTSFESNGKKRMMLFGSAGFEIRNKDGVGLAGVSLVDNGKVYLSATDAKERFLLANACSALLLHQAID